MSVIIQHSSVVVHRSLRWLHVFRVSSLYSYTIYPLNIFTLTSLPEAARVQLPFRFRLSPEVALGTTYTSRGFTRFHASIIKKIERLLASKVGHRHVKFISCLHYPKREASEHINADQHDIRYSNSQRLAKVLR